MDSLTQPQIKRPGRLRGEQIVGGKRKGARVADRPNRRPRGARPNSRLAKGALVAGTQSYLNVDRC